MGTLPEMYRIALSPFQAHSPGVQSVVRYLAPQGFVADQLCLIGTPTVIGPLATGLDPELRKLIGELAIVSAVDAQLPIVASAGLITDVLLRQRSWLFSPAAASLRPHLEGGEVILAINAMDHDQFVTAARLLLRHGSGNVLTEIFNWPTLPRGGSAGGK